MKNREQLRCNVRTVYSNVAETPSSTYPFPVGQKFAKELGYTRAVPNGVPEAAKSLTGVSNVAVFADIAEGDHVLDVGCGAGLDSYIAAQKVGLSGSVIGIDFSSEMVGRAQRTIGESYSPAVKFLQGDAENLPVRDGLIDIALVNGLFNLNLFRESIFFELNRVLRTNGKIFAAELIIQEDLPQSITESETDWFR